MTGKKISLLFAGLPARFTAKQADLRDQEGLALLCESKDLGQLLVVDGVILVFTGLAGFTLRFSGGAPSSKTMKFE